MSALWCPLATPTTLLGFLLPWAWGISSWLLQQSAAIAPYLGRGVSPHRRPSWPSMWDSSSRPSWARAATAPLHGVAPSGRRPWPRAQGHGVAPPSHRPWPETLGISSQPHPRPRMRGSSSQPFLCRRSLVLSAAAPDLGRRVTPLGWCKNAVSQRVQLFCNPMDCRFPGSSVHEIFQERIPER